MSPRTDVLVVGAGPAGMNAALAAADAGCTVTVIDSGVRPGGQYYRQLPDAFHAATPGALHHDFAPAQRLFDRLSAHPRITHRSSVSVWSAEREGADFRLHLVDAARPGVSAGTAEAPAVVLATGAYDRPLPFPGWDLPGVVTAGGAQALVKGQRVLVGQRVVVSGTGPFLLPVAAGLAEAGAKVVGVYEAGHPAAWRRHLPVVWRHRGKLAEGAAYLRVLGRHKVPMRNRWAVVEAAGDGRVERVTIAKLRADWTVVPGSERTVEADAVCVGYGFVPSIELALLLGCATTAGVDQIPVVRADDSLATSVPGIFAAGEVTGVGGSALASVEGTIAGLAVAGHLGKISASDVARQLVRPRADRAHALAFAAALADVYRVQDGSLSWMRPDTLVCRCEEVPLARVQQAVDSLGARDLRTVKLTSRTGMGMCQGRMCGATVAAVLRSRAVGAGAGGAGQEQPVDTGLSTRPLVVPVTLGLLAGTADPAGDVPTDGGPPTC